MIGAGSAEWLLPFATRVLHVRRSEIERTLFSAVLAIVLGCAMYTAFNATQAIFLIRAGARQYPIFYIILALSVWPMVTLQGALTRRFGVGRAFRASLALNSIVPLLVFLAYRLSHATRTPAVESRVAFAAYVVYSVAFELVMLHFWAFVSQHFNLLEGKRIYPIIAAGSSIGYILAGVITQGVASLPTTSLGPTEPLMFVWAAGAALAGILVGRIDRRLFRPIVEDEADELMASAHVERRRAGAVSGLLSALGYLRASRLMLALVTLAMVLMVAMRISDYLVARIFVRNASDLQSLTVLIGRAWLLAYVVQLLLALFVTPVLLARAGVKNAILALPIASVIGFGAVAVSPVLATSLFLFVIRNGLQTGVDDPAETVLSSALPDQVVPKLKLLMDDIVLPGSAVVAGLILIGGAALVGDRSLRDLAVTGIVISVIFVGAALWVRSLYVNAIYERLRHHALSLSDLVRAFGKPDPAQVAELQLYVKDEDPKVRQFAAAALGRLAPDGFAEMLPELVNAEDPFLRRLAFQLAPAARISLEMLEKAAEDSDPWVVAAAAVSGLKNSPPWPRSLDLLAELANSDPAEAGAAAVWAASFTNDEIEVVAGLSDTRPRVRLEAIRSFAKLKGNVRGAGGPLVACFRDTDAQVRRESMEQAIRWAPPASDLDEFADALTAGLTSPDGVTRRLAAEAIAVQCPDALVKSIALLQGNTGTGTATLEALVRSGRRDLVGQAHAFMTHLMQEAIRAAQLAARLRALARIAGGGEDERFAFLRVALDDFVRHSIEMAIASMRAQHGKRGFATVERGIRSDVKEARAEAVETLLNFGPSWLAEPLAQLLDTESFDAGPGRPLGSAELELLENHPDKWVKRAAGAVKRGLGERMKELIALKKVPLFATLTLEQLASIDRLMITRRYLKGETVFRSGDMSAEMYVVLDGEVRIHRDTRGKEVTLARLGPSTIMGEMALFTGEPRAAGAQAATDCTLRVLRKDRLNAVVHEHPEVLLEVVKILSQRLNVANAQLEAAAGSARETPGSDAMAARPREAAGTAGGA